MNYDAFKSRWTRALDGAHLLSPHDHPEETLDIGHMDRLYSISLGLSGPQPAEPFTVTCVLRWRWDALQSARTSTNEGDLLTELHGREDAADMETQRPWLRVDVKLHATLPWGQPQPMPSTPTWRRWVSEVTEHVVTCFPVEEIDFRDGVALLGWCGQPTAKVQCEADGRIMLAGVELEAWQPITLTRKWDDPERTPDPDPGGQLAELAGRLREALRRWAECVRLLRIPLE